MEPITNHNNSSNKLENKAIRNTHCIACGKAFTPSRVGKLFCSARCRQYAWNHRDELKSSKENSSEGEIKEFNINKYTDYRISQEALKYLTTLKRRDKEGLLTCIFHRKYYRYSTESTTLVDFRK